MLKTFWIVRFKSKSIEIDYSKFSRKDVQSFMKINNILKLDNPNWELHQIDDSDEEKIISHYEMKTTITENFQDEINT